MPHSSSSSSSSSSSASYSKSGSLSVKKMQSPGLSVLHKKYQSTLDSVPERHSVKAGESRERMWDKALHSTVGSREPPSRVGVSGGDTKGDTKDTKPQLKPSEAGGEKKDDGKDAKAKLKQAKDTVLKALQSRLLVAVVVMLFTMMLLLILNPPMAQQPLCEADKKNGKKCKRSWKKILLWSSLPAALALLLPFCFGKRDAHAGAATPQSCVNGSCAN